MKTIMSIQERLFSMRDEKYANFNARLIPNIPKECIIGVRAPLLRSLAKEYKESAEAEQFLNSLPHKYHDENMLHAFIISQIRSYNTAVKATDVFLPYIDNWAVCDSLSPKVFATNKEQLLKKITCWISSEHIYTCRFGIITLMRHFLDTDFKPEYLKLVAEIHSSEYYINMMIAWFFATALAKQWDDTIIYFEQSRLDTWVNNKAIQKSCESRRITKEKSKYLKKFKIPKTR